MTHHQPAHGEQNAEEGFQRPQAVLCAILSLQSSHMHQYSQSPSEQWKDKCAPADIIPNPRQSNADQECKKLIAPQMEATIKRLNNSLNHCFH